MAEITYRALAETDQTWLSDFIAQQWGTDQMVSRGKLFQPSKMHGFAAFRGGQCVGLVTYQIMGDQCEVTTLNSVEPLAGIGTRLLELVREHAYALGVKRLWLITTNDNLNALRFYQKRGWSLVAVYPRSLDAARQLKPQIPLIGEFGIPLRDEIELEFFPS